LLLLVVKILKTLTAITNITCHPLQ